jgi:hypothetical protein
MGTDVARDLPWLLLLVIMGTLAAACAGPPQGMAATTPGTPTTPAGDDPITVSLYVQPPAIQGLHRPWPKLPSGEWDSSYEEPTPRNVTLCLSDGRRLSCWTKIPWINLYHKSEVTIVSFFPLTEPKSLEETNAELRRILAEWAIPESTELAELYRKMAAASGIGNSAHIKLCADADLHVRITPALTSEERYVLLLSVSEPVERMLSRPAR